MKATRISLWVASFVFLSTFVFSMSGAARAQGSNPYGDSYAIVIGINAYQGRTPRLNYAVNDARSIQESLSKLGFSEITVLLDEEATGQAIRRAFGELSRKTTEKDRVFVFFAGHGLTINLPGGGGEMGYLLPVEGDTERIVSTGIAMSEVRDLSLLLPAKHVFFAVATAYSGLMAARSVVVTQRPEAQVDVDHLTRGRVRQILTAGERDQPVLEEGGHGLFTRRLLEGLEGEADVSPRDGILTADELAAFVQGRVIASSSNRQTPFFGTMDGVGQFVFSVPEPGEGRPQADASDRDRVGHLAELLQDGSITGRGYEEAKRVLKGEFQADRERGLLPIVRELADGRLTPRVYRLARDGVMGGRTEPRTTPPRRDEVDELTSLLNRADSQFSRRRYTTPAGDNAYETLEEVMRLDPGNERALQKLQEMAEIYRVWGERDFERRGWIRARRRYERILLIFPEDREAQDRLAAIEQAEQEKVTRETREEEERERLARIEHERTITRLEEEQEAREARLQRESGFSRVDGVWTTERTGDWQTEQGVSYPTERTLTLTLQDLDGRTVRGVLVAGQVDTLPPDNYWVDETTRERCGVGPDGRVRHAEGRQPLEGTVHEDGSVTFTTSSGDILLDECSLLLSGGVDSIQPTGTYSGELSPDGLSLTLNWTWADFLGGDSIILSAADPGRRVSPPRPEEVSPRVDRVSPRADGVWRVVGTSQDSTDGGTSFPSERTLTLEFYVEGRRLRGSLTTHPMGTLPSENYWVDEVTQERCGGEPDGRVRHTEGRQPLRGTVVGRSVTFTTFPGAIVVDDGSLLRKHGPDRLLDTGTFNGELSPDGGSITLDWQWAEFLGGGNMVFTKVGGASPRPERTLSSVEGVWRTVRIGQDETDEGIPYPSDRAITVTFRVEGTTLRGSLTTRGVGTLPSENYWVDEVTSERCGGAPDGRVRHTEGRQPLEGSVHGDGSVTFTTSSGESIVDDCGLLQKHGPDRLLDTGTFNGELSPDGGSITLDWEWADFLGGGNMILSRVDEGSQRLGSVDPGVRGDINILIVYENRFDEKLQELLSQLRGLGYDPSLGNVSEGFSCTANARSLALGGRTNGAVLDELRDITNGVMPGFFTEWLDETESNHIYLCESEG